MNAFLTCAPSGLLSLPPDDDTMYGLFVSACRHRSLKESMSSQNLQPSISHGI
jgi:hypothetical protein